VENILSGFYRESGMEPGRRDGRITSGKSDSEKEKVAGCPPFKIILMEN